MVEKGEIVKIEGVYWEVVEVTKGQVKIAFFLDPSKNPKTKIMPIFDFLLKTFNSEAYRNRDDFRNKVLSPVAI